jgi:hypothetical protein
MDKSGRFLIEVLSRCLPGGTEETIGQDSRCPGQDSNSVLPQFECRALPLDEPAETETEKLPAATCRLNVNCH